MTALQAIILIGWLALNLVVAVFLLRRAAVLHRPSARCNCDECAGNRKSGLN